MKSSDGKMNAKERANSGNGRNGKGLNGFHAAMPLFDREVWGVAFPGLGAALPGPGLYEKGGQRQKSDGKEEEPLAVPERNKAGFDALHKEAFSPREDRCAW